MNFKMFATSETHVVVISVVQFWDCGERQLGDFLALQKLSGCSLSLMICLTSYNSYQCQISTSFINNNKISNCSLACWSPINTQTDLADCMQAQQAEQVQHLVLVTGLTWGLQCGWGGVQGLLGCFMVPPLLLTPSSGCLVSRHLLQARRAAKSVL